VEDVFRNRFPVCCSGCHSGVTFYGQHRLFAYSGLPEAHTGKLSVLAFEGLEAADQARLFIDINAKQKKVKQSLLEELYSDLHWDADQDSVRVQGIVSKAIQDIGNLSTSPFFQRIQTSDSSKDGKCCISLNSVFRALEKSHLYIVKEKHGKPIEYGPLWTGDNDATLDRTISFLNAWFSRISEVAADWWVKGADEGGGLSMNDGITACILVLRSVCDYMENAKLVRLSTDDLNEVLDPYAIALGEYLGSLTEGQRKSFRELRGGQGQLVRMRMCQAGIRQKMESFNPAGLDKFLEEEKMQTNQQGKEIIDRIERFLKKSVVEELKTQIGPEEIDWWMQGVPSTVRKKVTERREDDKGERGGKENYFDLLDYFKIALEQWKMFEPLLALEKTGKKEQRLGWIEKLNKFRNGLFHPSSGVTLSIEDLSLIQSYERALYEKQSSSSSVESENAESEDDE
jgi:DNA sulfur modification protein DndB